MYECVIDLLVVADDEVVIAVLYGVLVELGTIVGDAEVVEVVGPMAAPAGGSLSLLQRQGPSNTEVLVAFAAGAVEAHRFVAFLQERHAHDEAVQSQHGLAYKVPFGDVVREVFFVAGAGENPLVVVGADGAELSRVVQGRVELGHHLRILEDEPHGVVAVQLLSLLARGKKNEK